MAELIPLFRKDTLLATLKDKQYIPQITPNCRWFRKPNTGTCGMGITIHDVRPEYDEDYSLSPEVLSDLCDGHKYDWRVWVGICSDRSYHICLPAVQRISQYIFSNRCLEGSITNIAQGSTPIFHDNLPIIDKIDVVVKDVVDLIITTPRKNSFMLTGWDFIVDKNGQVVLLEINSSPGMSNKHKPLMDNFLQWVFSHQ